MTPLLFPVRAHHLFPTRILTKMLTKGQISLNGPYRADECICSAGERKRNVCRYTYVTINHHNHNSNFKGTVLIYAHTHICISSFAEDGKYMKDAVLNIFVAKWCLIFPEQFFYVSDS